MKNSTCRSRLYTVGAIACLFILWHAVSWAVGAEILLPFPGETLRDLIRITGTKDFGLAVLNTTSRSLAGFGIAFVSAVFLAVSAALWKPLHYFLNPLVVLTKATPTISIILLALIWMNTETAPVLIGLMVIFPIIYTNIMTGLENMDTKLIQMSSMYGVGKLRMIKELYFPSILPYVLSASSTAIGLNLKVIIAAEVLSQPKISIGTSLQMEKVYLNTAGVFAWTLVAVLLSAAFDYIIFLIRKGLERWK